MPTTHELVRHVASGLLAGTLALSPTAQDEAPVELVSRLGFEARGGLAYALAVRPDGKSIAVGGEGGQVYLANIETGERAWTTRIGTRTIRFLRFSPDGKHLAVGTGTLKVLRAHDGSVAAEEFGPLVLGDAAFTGDGTTMAFTTVIRPSDECELTLVSTRSWNIRARHRFGGFPPTALLHRPEPEAWIVGDNGGGVRAIDASTGEEELLRELPGDGAFIATLKDLGWMGGKLSGVTWAGEVFIGDEQIKRPKALYFAKFDRRRDCFATYSPKDKLLLWNVKGEFEKFDCHTTALEFAPDGALAVATTGGRLKWLEDGVIRDGFDLGLPGQRTKSLTFSRDGEFVIAAGNVMTITEIKTGVRHVLARTGKLFPGRSGAEFFVKPNQDQRVHASMRERSRRHA